MAEVDEEATFDVGVDQALFRTRTNGDELRLRNLNLGQAAATSIAWLINANTEAILEVNIKLKE
jgi:hypothetical protein